MEYQLPNWKINSLHGGVTGEGPPGAAPGSNRTGIGIRSAKLVAGSVARRRGKHRLHEARAELYRRHVRETAERVFAERGFAKAPIARIAREAGVSVGTLYRAFPGRKLEMYRAIQDEHGAALMEATRSAGTSAWEQRNDLLDAVLAGLTALVEYFVAHPDFLRLVLREEKAWAVEPGGAPTKDLSRWREGVAGSVMAMRQGITDGVLVDDDPELMARTLLALQQAHLGYWLEERMRVPPAEVVVRLHRQFLRAFCRPEVLAARGLPPLPQSTKDA